MIARTDITGGILAGGRGERFGGVDKGLEILGGLPLVAHVVARLAPQVGRIHVSANRNLGRYADHAERVVTDALAGQPGPLAGIAALLAVCPSPWLLVVPCDTPFLPADLVSRLVTAAPAPDTIVVARAAGRLQPVHALLPRALVADVEAFLAGGGRRVEDWQARHPCLTVKFDDADDCFFNVNNVADLARGAPPGPP